MIYRTFEYLRTISAKKLEEVKTIVLTLHKIRGNFKHMYSINWYTEHELITYVNN